jgi:two-component system sensor histidine kinase DctS
MVGVAAFSWAKPAAAIVDFRSQPPQVQATIATMVETRASTDNLKTGWLWLLPRASFVLFIVAVGALLWLSERSDKDEQRATLISDMLWLEQDLRFHLSHNEELLGQIGLRQAADASTFEAHARALTDNQTGLRRVRWLEASGHLRFELPVSLAPAADPESQKLARSLGKPVYGRPYTFDDEWWFDAYVPIVHEGAVAGIVAGSYSLPRLLEESVPWWLAERYRIVVADSGGKILASRTKVAAPEAEAGYQLAFEPPGGGLVLQATPYRSPAPLAGKLISGALVVLAGLVLWSLWALRRHVQGRLTAEEALREEHAFRKAMEDSLQTGLRARDLHGRITYVNPAFCTMVGWSTDELVGRAPPMPYWVDEDFEATRALHDRILAGAGPSRGFEIRLKRRNGEIFPALIHEAPLIDIDGRHTGWMSSVIDITDQKRAEDLARQQQERLQATARLVTMGEMASSLAHEVNQPLSAIASYSAGCLNLLESRPDNQDIRGAIAKTMEQAQRAGRIIRRIYEFVRRAEPKSELCTIEQLLDETVALAEPEAHRQKVLLTKDIQGNLPPIKGDRILLIQVFLNLIRNAVEAMKDVPPADRRLLVSAAAIDGQVMVSVADNGPGISTEAASRLFEPFFTTKSEGMGMGLNICRSIVEGHRGRLWFEAGASGGSIFHVLLPPAAP